MLDLKGNTAVYLLYAHARIAGIVRKVRVCAGARQVCRDPCPGYTLATIVQ
jgi:arginyl-tRNA synthetase